MKFIERELLQIMLLIQTQNGLVFHRIWDFYNRDNAAKVDVSAMVDDSGHEQTLVLTALDRHKLSCNQTREAN